MRSVRRVLGLAVLATVLAAPAGAQESGRIILQGAAGGLRGLANLDNNGTYETSTGLNLNGSLGYQVIDRLVFRADVVYATTPIQFQGGDFGADLNRVFASGIAQVQWPSDAAITPYILAGGGLLFHNQNSTAEPKHTLGHFVTGAGFSWRLGASAVSLVAETRMYLYQGRGLLGNSASDPRVQFDGAAQLGLSYAFR